MRRTIITLALVLGAATGCSVQTTGAPKGGAELTATFDDVQSLVVGHSVQVSDVRVGTVTRIGLSGYRAKVTMSLEKGRRIPAGTTAAIARTSLLGENYVRLDLPPGASLTAGPFLASGASITRTSVEPDLQQINERVAPLLAAVGGQDLATITDESATALHGRGKKLNTLIAQAAAVSQAYAAASADIDKAITGLARLGDSLEKGSAKLDRLPGDILLVTERLKADRAQLKRSIQQLQRLATSTNARVQLRHARRLAEMLQRADALLVAAMRGSREMKELANAVLTFLDGPRVTHNGNALLYLWLKGFLEEPRRGGGTAAGAPNTPNSTGSLQRLLEPRP